MLISCSVMHLLSFIHQAQNILYRGKKMLLAKVSPLKNLTKKCQFANFSWQLLVVPDVLPSSEYLIFTI